MVMKNPLINLRSKALSFLHLGFHEHASVLLCLTDHNRYVASPYVPFFLIGGDDDATFRVVRDKRSLAIIGAMC